MLMTLPPWEPKYFSASWDTELTARKLADLPMVIIAAPDYLARRGVPHGIDDLRGHACLQYLLAGRAYPFMFADGTTFTPDGPLDSDDGITLFHAALHGAGIAQVLRFAAEDDLTAGRLVELLPIWRGRAFRCRASTPSAGTSRSRHDCSSICW